MKEHIIKEHPIEFDHGRKEEEMESSRTTPLSRKRGRPRGPGKKKMRENNLGQELQWAGAGSSQHEGGASQADVSNKRWFCLHGNDRLYCVLRSVGSRRIIGVGGEDLDSWALELLLRNLQRHEDSWPFVRWRAFVIDLFDLVQNSNCLFAGSHICFIIQFGNINFLAPSGLSALLVHLTTAP